jgi:hypothetical protein
VYCTHYLYIHGAQQASLVLRRSELSRLSARLPCISSRTFTSNSPIRNGCACSDSGAQSRFSWQPLPNAGQIEDTVAKEGGSRRRAVHKSLPCQQLAWYGLSENETENETDNEADNEIRFRVKRGGQHDRSWVFWRKNEKKKYKRGDSFLHNPLNTKRPPDTSTQSPMQFPHAFADDLHTYMWQKKEFPGRRKRGRGKSWADATQRGDAAHTTSGRVGGIFEDVTTSICSTTTGWRSPFTPVLIIFCRLSTYAVLVSEKAFHRNRVSSHIRCTPSTRCTPIYSMYPMYHIYLVYCILAGAFFTKI